MNRRTLLALSLILLLTQLACGAAGSRNVSHNRSTGRSSAHFTRETESKGLTYEVREGMREAELRIDVALDEGNLQWELRDPEGTLRWEGETGGRYEEMREFAPVPGTWTLEVSTQRATGEYEMHWQAE